MKKLPTCENFAIPILFIVFNRPELTQLVFNQIKKIRPHYLFIAADGPREGNRHDTEQCVKTREIVQQIDWDCNIQTLFREKNVGCGAAVSSAISWIFEHHDKAIILEDDCMPSISFFHFCKELLVKYQNDERICTITGTNFFDDLAVNEDSYFFSKYATIWGWATWKRVWESFDLSMSTWPRFRDNYSIFNDIDKIEAMFAYNMYEKAYQTIQQTGGLKTWDIQFGFNIWSNRRVGIVPSKNLVSNLGSIGTHTQGRSILHHLNIVEDFSISKHPEFFICFDKWDRKFYNTFRRKTIFKRIKSRAKKILLYFIGRMRDA